MISCNDDVSKRREETLETREKELKERESALNKKEEEINKNSEVNQVAPVTKYLFTRTTIETVYNSNQGEISGSELSNECKNGNIFEVQFGFSKIYTVENFDEEKRYKIMDFEEAVVKGYHRLVEPWHYPLIGEKDPCPLGLQFSRWKYKTESFLYDSYKDASIELHELKKENLNYFFNQN